MKYFYILIPLILLSLALLFSSGCSTVGLITFVPDQRQEVFHNTLKSLNDLVRQTGNEDSQKILSMFQKESVLITPTKDGFRDPKIWNERETLKVVVLLPEDSRFPSWSQIVSDKKSYAYFFPRYNVIVLKRMDELSPVFQAITVDHEGWHAFHFQSDSIVARPLSSEHLAIERDTYEHGASLLSSIGGEPYKMFMREEMKRIDAFVKNSVGGNTLPALKNEYNEKLDKIFGVAQSDTEKRSRVSFIGISGIFQYIDENYHGTQPEKELAKSNALLNIYRHGQ